MDAPKLPREITIADWFKVYVPESAKCELVDEDGTTVVFHLMADREPLYLRRYDLPMPYSPDQSALVDEAQRFLEQGIIPVCDQICGSNIETGEVNGACYAQLLAKLSESHWWLARLVTKPGLSSYFLLHCNGDEELLVLATAVFSEFYVLG